MTDAVVMSQHRAGRKRATIIRDGVWRLWWRGYRWKAYDGDNRLIGRGREPNYDQALEVVTGVLGLPGADDTYWRVAAPEGWGWD